MYIKHIWESDPDYKVYKDQIFTNLHETHSNQDYFDRNIASFFDHNNISMPEDAEKSKYQLLDWGIDEEQIKTEMERQEIGNRQVSLLFAMKWFNSELTNKGKNSALVNGLIVKDKSKSVKKVKT